MAPGNRKPFSGKQKKQLLREKREQKAGKRPLGADSLSESERESKSTTTGRSTEEIFIRQQAEQENANPNDHHQQQLQQQHETLLANKQTLNSTITSNLVRTLSSAKGDCVLEATTKQADVNAFTADNIYMINAQPDNIRTNYDVNRYALQFFRESDAELTERKKDAAEPYAHLNETELEINSEAHKQISADVIDFPKRPPWNFSLSREKLLSNEYNYFRKYLAELEHKYGSLAALSYFEMNLETWRQLWRTLEMSDIVLLITDIRYSVFHFPTSIYNYVVNDLKKDIILVLNKCDLIAPELVLAWINYWRTKFPSIHVVPFASYAGMKTKDKGKTKGRRFGKFYMASESVRHLYDACDKIVQGRIQMQEWKQKIEDDIALCKARVDNLVDITRKLKLNKQEDGDDDQDLEEDDEQMQVSGGWKELSEQDKWTDRRRQGYLERKPKKMNRKTRQRMKKVKKSQQKLTSEDDSDENDVDEEEEESVLVAQEARNKGRLIIEEQDYDYHEFKSLDQGVLTIGCIGHPNVGKSSVLNAIMGEIVVSVSRTPGHTKHFQTIFLTKNVRLCDCPGLVFPSRVPKPLQILMGCFPIAQLREPYTAVKFIAERIDLVKLLRIQKSEDWNFQGWSAIEICEQWAIKRGYYAAKSARPDIYRAANQLLRMALDGRTICLTFYPPNYVKELDSRWKNHPDLPDIRFLRQQVDSKEKERTFKTKLKDLDLLAFTNAEQKSGEISSEPEILDSDIEVACP